MSRPVASTSLEAQQTPEEIAALVTDFLAAHPAAAVLEDGKVAFDLREARYALDATQGRCMMQIWSEQRNVVRRIAGAVTRGGTLRLSAYRMGQSRASSLEMVADRVRRTPSSRETERTHYLRLLERVVQRGSEGWGDWKAEGFRTAMDLERSFGPAYARGLLVQGQSAWAVIAAGAGESQAVLDGILTPGVLWLTHCRESSGGRRSVHGLRVILPRGAGALTASRLAWMNPAAARWELWELNEASEELEQRDPADHGNLNTRVIQAAGGARTQERFAKAGARVMELVPEELRTTVEQRMRSSAEMAFLLNGLEFARVRDGYAGQSFNRVQEITFGSGASETRLTDQNGEQMRESVRQLGLRRRPGADKRDPLYRMSPERWLESVLRRDVSALDERLDAGQVYAQVPAFAASDRGMLDLLSVDREGRLAVIELKAAEDLHLALQGLDYWVRVRWHHASVDAQGSGLDEFQRHGYFPGMRLCADDPRLYLVAPALRVHPATEVVLRYLSPRIEWELVALGERWREKIQVVWRRRSGPVQRPSAR